MYVWHDKACFVYCCSLWFLCLLAISVISCSHVNILTLFLLLELQAFAESQDYGVHGERVRKACWGYLCRGGAVELQEVCAL